MQPRRFTDGELNELLSAQSALTFSYADVGASAAGIPAGFDHDRQRVVIGHGDADFAAACEALRGWRQFPVSWTAIFPAAAPLAAGTSVLMLCRVLGLWWANGCRIVYTIDEAGPPRQFGFAYGTLPSHVECGEERFVVERDELGQVWYELAAFSRPRHWLLKLGYPLVRQFQAKFRRDSAAAMRLAVENRS
jgi:uncharacterized protein (UPF0548 family)